MSIPVSREGFIIVTKDGQLSHSDNYTEFYEDEYCAKDRVEEIQCNITHDEEFKVVPTTITYKKLS